MSRITLVDAAAITTAGTAHYPDAAGITGYGDAQALIVHTFFDWGSGGTTINIYVQTSLDGGSTWVDIMQWSATTGDFRKMSKVSVFGAAVTNVTPADGTLAANTVQDGIIGDRLRVKVVTTGTYATTTLTINAEAK